MVLLHHCQLLPGTQFQAIWRQGWAGGSSPQEFCFTCQLCNTPARRIAYQKVILYMWCHCRESIFYPSMGTPWTCVWPGPIDLKQNLIATPSLKSSQHMFPGFVLVQCFSTRDTSAGVWWYSWDSQTPATWQHDKEYIVTNSNRSFGSVGRTLGLNFSCPPMSTPVCTESLSSVCFIASGLPIQK